MYHSEQEQQQMAAQVERMCKNEKREKRFQKILNWIGFIALAVFAVACIWALIIGQPIVILASFIIVGFVGILLGGFNIKDLVFLIWWGSGRK